MKMIRKSLARVTAAKVRVSTDNPRFNAGDPASVESRKQQLQVHEAVASKDWQLIHKLTSEPQGNANQLGKLDYASRKGVSLRVLQALRDFILDAGTVPPCTKQKCSHQDSCCNTWSVNTVWQYLLLPFTVQQQNTFADAIRSFAQDSTHPLVGANETDIGVASVFVSYSRESSFVNLVKALESYAVSSGNEKAFFWMDIFVVNQHQSLAVPFYQSIHELLSSMNHVVWVIGDWQDPKPLSRLWCIWEIIGACGIGHNVSVLMDESAEQAAIKTSRSLDISSVLKRICDTNTEDAEASVTSDLMILKQAIRDMPGGGVDAADEIVHGVMRSWLLDLVAGEWGNQKGNDAGNGENLLLMLNLGKLYLAQGAHSLAEPLLKEAVTVARATRGEGHPHTLKALDALANLYNAQGDFAQAEPLYVMAIQWKQRTLGRNHPSTVESLNSLGLQYNEHGRFSEAEPLFAETLLVRRDILGDGHSDTFTTMNNLAYVLMCLEKFEEAEPLFLEALEGERYLLGDEHPDTVLSMVNLGLLYERSGRYTEAEPLYAEALDHRKMMLGEDHHETLESMSNLASIYQLLEKFDLAEPLFKETLDKSRQVLGSHHPDTIVAMFNLGQMYEEQGKLTDAVEVLMEELDTLKEAKGERHPDTVVAAEHVSRLLTMIAEGDD